MRAAIAAIRLVSADAERLAAFYERAFGFVREADAGGLVDPYVGPTRRTVRLRLGRQHVEVVEFDPLGAPASSDGPDTRFQHFALVAPSMAAAMRRLDGVAGWTPITRGGPQTLPESSGGVTAFKFRDPEGHPLELLTFPDDRAPEDWRGGSAGVLGIDHTAIVVRDTARSVAFYASLGFERVGGSLNVGPEQAHLDGVPDPEVEVTALGLPGAPPPHLELLRYRRAAASPVTDSRDVAATRTIIARPGAAKNRAEALTDPDGHRWIVIGNNVNMKPLGRAFAFEPRP